MALIAEIVDALVSTLQGMPDLAELLGDADRIKPYHYRYPLEKNITLAVKEMDVPGILVAWRGTDKGYFADGYNLCFRHNFSLYIRAEQQRLDDPPGAYYAIWDAIINYKPGDQTNRWIDLPVHGSCLPMRNEDLPDMQQRTDVETFDYFESRLSLVQIGY